MAERGRRGRANLFGAGLLSLAGVVVLFGATIWQRNNAQVAAIESRLQKEFVAPLQVAITQSRNVLPLEFPARNAADRAQGHQYHYPTSEDVWALRRATEPVIVGYAGRLTLFIRPDGYFVVEFHKGRLRIEWLCESDFFKRITAQQQWIKNKRATLDAGRHRTPELP
ncbi:MAG: hypothetical protein JSV19_13265 [Phycisphaerales bacterium]|nr:MAG: hypothetical protein JSV19_13265 [Phycisphaerales bacterium]